MSNINTTVADGHRHLHEANNALTTLLCSLEFASCSSSSPDQREAALKEAADAATTLRAALKTLSARAIDGASTPPRAIDAAR